MSAIVSDPQDGPDVSMSQDAPGVRVATLLEQLVEEQRWTHDLLRELIQGVSKLHSDIVELIISAAQRQM